VSAPGCFFAAVILLALGAAPAVAAPAAGCETLQARIKALATAIRRAPTREAAARMEAERDRLSKQSAARCPEQVGKMPERSMATGTPPADTPEEEIRQRREAINRKQAQLEAKPGAPRAGAGGREAPVARALPLDGTLLLEGGASTTFYGKVKQELTYTIRETFVGNLIVTRYYDRVGGRYAGREDYAIQTLSTEIDVDHFSGRGCVKYSGSPPVCTQWHRFDLWQIGDGEEYPGKDDGVVSAGSDGRGVVVKVDGPNIEFFSTQGLINLTSGCGGQLREMVSRDEFKEWMRRSKVRIKRDMGATRPTGPGCRPDSTLTLEMHIGPGA